MSILDDWKMWDDADPDNKRKKETPDKYEQGIFYPFSEQLDIIEGKANVWRCLKERRKTSPAAKEKHVASVEEVKSDLADIVGVLNGLSVLSECLIGEYHLFTGLNVKWQPPALTASFSCDWILAVLPTDYYWRREIPSDGREETIVFTRDRLDDIPNVVSSSKGGVPDKFRVNWRTVRDKLLADIQLTLDRLIKEADS